MVAIVEWWALLGAFLFCKGSKHPTWMYYTMHVSEMSQRLQDDLIHA
jgi:hypothetical protein